MSILIDNSITIYEALEHIKNGKYVMPAFQRQYVWSMEQIEKLWDSILLDYPIATFLFWHVDDNNVSWDTYFCNFLHEVTFDSRKQADSVNYELSSIDVKLTDTAILDGRLPFDGYVSCPALLAFKGFLVCRAPCGESFLDGYIGKVALACGGKRTVKRHMQMICVWMILQIVPDSLERTHGVAA